MLAAAHRVLANESDAEEIAQEVFMTIYLKYDLNLLHEQPALIRIMASRRALDRLRRRKVNVLMDDSIPGAQLNLVDVSGTLDISNDFGDTTLSLKGPILGSNRLVSQSGRILVELDEGAFNSTVVNAFTNHGGVRTNIARKLLGDHHFVSQNNTQGWRQNWNGFRKVEPSEDRFATLELPKQLEGVLHGKSQPPGLHIVTRAGNIDLLLK